MHGGKVTGGSDFIIRENFLEAFQFLKTDYIGLVAEKKIGQAFQTGADRIYIPGGDFHMIPGFTKKKTALKFKGPS